MKHEEEFIKNEFIKTIEKKNEKLNLKIEENENGYMVNINENSFQYNFLNPDKPYSEFKTLVQLNIDLDRANNISLIKINDKKQLSKEVQEKIQNTVDIIIETVKKDKPLDLYNIIKTDTEEIAKSIGFKHIKDINVIPTEDNNKDFLVSFNTMDILGNEQIVEFYVDKPSYSIEKTASDLIKDDGKDEIDLD